MAKTYPKAVAPKQKQSDTQFTQKQDFNIQESGAGQPTKNYTKQLDVNKGVTANGQFYPTTNPDFKPNSNPDKSVSFQDNGRVQVTTGGQTYDLSKEEYAGQLVTPQTMAIDQNLAGIRQEKGIQAIAANDARKQVATEQFKQKLTAPALAQVQKEGAAQGQDQSQNPTVQTSTVAPQNLDAQTSPIQDSVINEAGIQLTGNDAKLYLKNQESKKQLEAGKISEWEYLKSIYSNMEAMDWVETALMASGTAAATAGAPSLADAAAKNIYGNLAKSAGWKYSSAALKAGWTPSMTQIVSYAAKTALSWKSIAGVSLGSTAIRVTLGDAKAIKNAAEADKKGIIEKVKTGSMSYSEAVKNFDLNDASIDKAAARVDFISKLPIPDAITSAADAREAFIIEKRNRYLVRQELDNVEAMRRAGTLG